MAGMLELELLMDLSRFVVIHSPCRDWLSRTCSRDRRLCGDVGRTDHKNAALQWSLRTSARFFIHDCETTKAMPLRRL